MARMAHTIAVALALSSFSLIGCNAVLGIDEAHLADSGTGGGSSINLSSKVTTRPGKDCSAPSAACASCIEASDCADAKAACLADAACRVALNAYRVCLGSQCSDAGGACLSTFSTYEAQLHLALIPFSTCVQEQCRDQCKDMPLVPPCELYCGCMAPNCTTELAARGTPLVDCQSACDAATVDDLTCRWTHCEIAATHPNQGHCGHAIGEVFCNAKTVVSSTCSDKSQSSYACDTGDDCCSSKCNHNVCD
jgi:hypothetical protein